MSIIVRIPGSLREWFGGKDKALCEGRTIGECFDQLGNRYPGLRDRLLDDKNQLSSILVFLNGDNIRNLEGLATAVKDGDEIGIIPLAAGG
jgi:molybdopterin synthase sulfur carrier subunit